MTDAPADWILIEAAKQGGSPIKELHRLRQIYLEAPNTFTALCDMIAKHEQPPVDRKLLCAREAMAECCVLPESEGAYRRGAWDHADALKRCLRAIELYLEGYGK